MKIKKTIQGSIPSNKVYNSYNEDKHNVYSTEYLNDKLVCVSSTKPTNNEMVWIQRGKNLFNINGLFAENGRTTMTYSASGFAYEISSDYTGEGYSRYVPVLEKNKTYTFSFAPSSGVVIAGVRFIKNPLDPDNNFTALSQVSDTCFRGTNNKDYKYIRFWIKGSKSGGVNAGSITDIQLEEGDTPTTYETYIKNQIFFKDGNSGYKKFYEEVDDNPNTENYSTEERVIGKWLDKPLYRKVVVFTATLQEGDNLFSHGISNLGLIIRKELVNTSGTMIPYLTLNEVASIHKITSSDILIRCEGGSWGLATRYAILEYTKSTD